MRRYRNKHKPQLELLESRVMLSAADNPASLTPPDWATVVYGDATATVELLPYGHVLTITGGGHGSITVDLSGLPASVINLQISSFDSVTLTGDATLRDLVISDVKYADAGNASLERLFTYGVQHVRIDEAPTDVFLAGAKDANGLATLGDKTLFETNHFSPERSAFIFAFVQNLGLATGSHVETLPIVVSGSPTQSIMMNFQPDNTPKVIGVASQATIIQGNDFARYFLASPTERKTLEQSHLFVTQQAVIERLSPAALVNNSRLQAAIGEAFDGGSAAKSSLRPGTPDSGRPELGVNLIAATNLAVNNSQDSAVRTSAPADLPLVGTFASQHALPDDATAAEIAASVAAPIDISAGTVSVSVDATYQSDVAALSALSLALARLAEPFVQTVSDLQGRLATFGEIASAQVTNQLRTDGRPALLADTRVARQQRQEQEVLVVRI
jgi:hypothetical protein